MRDYLFTSEILRRPLHTIAIEVCERHKISFGEFISPCRKLVYAKARQEFSYLAHKSGASYPAIGKFLGGRDHTTIMHADRKYKSEKGIVDGAA